MAYFDLPLDLPETEKVLNEQGSYLVFSFAGVFPVQLRHGDVLRLQTFSGVDLHTADIVTASDHGHELLEYILEDLSDCNRRRAVLVVPLGPGGCPEDN